MKSRYRLALFISLFGLVNISAFCQATSPGRVRFIQRTTSDWDQYTKEPTSSFIEWINQKMSRTQLYTTYFDSRLSWYPNAWAYEDLYGIGINDPLVQQHPEWILKDSNGNRLYIPWGCSGSVCPNYAFDPGNPDFRNWWIENKGGKDIQTGYKGLWIDDVNLEFQVGNGDGSLATPIDARTGAPMTYEAWKSYVAGFTQAIRSALPNAEIAHNSIWYAGGSARDYDPSVIDEIKAADFINCERGVSDWGLQSGSGNNGDNNWSLNAFLAFIDHVHNLGKHVILEEYTFNGDGEYGVAGYFLISDGQDGFGNDQAGPYSWSKAYDVDLGQPQAGRYSWNNLLRRDFSGGIVLLNPAYSSPVTVTLPGTFQRADGSTLTSITLNGGQGAILIGQANDLASAGETLADGTYVVTNQYSGYVLDNKAFSVTSGAQVDQWASNGNPNQTWKFTTVGNGEYAIQNVFSGLYLTDVNGELQQVVQNNSGSQLWKVRAVSPGVFTLTNAATGKVIDNPKFSKTQGVGIITWPANNGPNQNWTIQ
jgi:hypothetical protein